MDYVPSYSSFYSENDSPPTQASMHRGGLGGRLLSVLFRGALRVTAGFVWLGLLGALHSVPLWLGIAVGWWLLSFSLSRLLGGTRFSLARMLLVLLLLSWRLARTGAILLWEWWPYFTLKPPWSFLALGLYGATFLYAWTLLLLQWGR